MMFVALIVEFVCDVVDGEAESCCVAVRCFFRLFWYWDVCVKVYGRGW